MLGRAFIAGALIRLCQVKVLGLLLTSWVPSHRRPGRCLLRSEDPAGLPRIVFQRRPSREVGCAVVFNHESIKDPVDAQVDATAPVFFNHLPQPVGEIAEVPGANRAFVICGDAIKFVRDEIKVVRHEVFKQGLWELLWDAPIYCGH